MSKMGWFGGSYGRLRSPEIAPIDRAFIRVPIALGLAVLVYRLVTDRQADGQADTR